MNGEQLYRKIMSNGGEISIEEFDKYEDILRPVMRSEGKRAMYRGPRRITRNGQCAGMTLREDAVRVSIKYFS